METAEFFREKASQCRSLATNLTDNAATARGLWALALELDARALAIEAGRATTYEIEPAISRQNGGNGGNGGTAE